MALTIVRRMQIARPYALAQPDEKNRRAWIDDVTRGACAAVSRRQPSPGRSWLIVLIAWLSSHAGCVLAAADGELVSTSPCAPNAITRYEQYLAAERKKYADEVEAARREGYSLAPPSDATLRLLNRREFEIRTRYEGFECRRVRYYSDGLQVVAYLWKPVATGPSAHPLIIYNRGGNREFGKVEPWRRFGFYEFVSQGFIVVAPQYRGADGGEGRDEFGGADVNDILNVLPLARELGYVDMENVFLFGRSRGGMMTALALKSGMRVRAAAIDAGLTDLIAARARRPALAENLWSELIPGYAERADELLRERSAVYWADRIDVPMLLLQGGADWRQSAADTLAFAAQLEKHGKVYQLLLYAYDDHQLSAHREEADGQVVQWFKLHTQ